MPRWRRVDQKYQFNKLMLSWVEWIENTKSIQFHKNWLKIENAKDPAGGEWIRPLGSFSFQHPRQQQHAGDYDDDDDEEEEEDDDENDGDEYDHDEDYENAFDDILSIWTSVTITVWMWFCPIWWWWSVLWWWWRRSMVTMFVLPGSSIKRSLFQCELKGGWEHCKKVCASNFDQIMKFFNLYSYKFAKSNVQKHPYSQV